MSSRYFFKNLSKLKNRSEFQTLFRNSKRLDFACFFILMKKNNCERARIGFSVSKKELPLAYTRNYFKRICKESFRCNQANLATVDIVIFAKKINGKLHQDLRQQVDAVWEKLK